jgi:hypothetical protein
MLVSIQISKNMANIRLLEIIENLKHTKDKSMNLSRNLGRRVPLGAAKKQSLKNLIQF